ncbi:benzoate/H(+) symporter BenE family transporter [Sneathiella chinensis]|uniref:Benzoate transporter n=1 Tax=Sneathiella chinensis TaxID=349750 RepID=A0ABQ5U4S5_9PROT|nr:benzoate/H(+) symporter BenE family transporter [Sneathiella chinensis]GLQ06914.1 benzoate transporter [Sneathiella chinensis]
MLKFFAPTYVISGFVAVLVGYTSAAAIVFQAAAAGGATPDIIASWMWALGLGMGISGIGLSLFYRVPIIIAWSTPGAALLVTSLPGIPMGDAVGAFLFSSLLLTLFGVTGWFEKIMKIIPMPLASAMLAGVLVRFGLDIFVAMESRFALIALMLVVYLAGRRFSPRYAIPATFLAGVLMATAEGRMGALSLDFALTLPVFTLPSFSLSTLIGVGLPLFIVTMASQNIPGVAVLRAHGYQTPASPLIAWAGAIGLPLAPFGGYAFNLAAITAALCMGDTVHSDRDKRYPAAVWAGLFYMLLGLFGALVAGVLGMFPADLIMGIAGLALLGTIGNSLAAAVTDEDSREAAFLTFLVTASGMSLLSIGAPFWGLVIGLTAHHLLRFRPLGDIRALFYRGPKA